MADLRVKAVSHVVRECITLAQKEYEKKKKKKKKNRSEKWYKHKKEALMENEWLRSCGTSIYNMTI